MLKEKDDLSWYSRKALSLKVPDGTAPLDGKIASVPGRVKALLQELQDAGIRGSVEGRTLYTRKIPLGCKGCLLGRGTNVYMTGLCTRDCFFCFNAKPRSDEIVAHGIKVKEPEDIPEIVSRYGLRSVGLSGGEPLLYPDRLLRAVRALRAMPERVRIELYTNGDLATDDTLDRLKEAGLDGIRFNLVANDFDTAPVRRALRRFPETAVEIPAVPAIIPRLERMVLELDELGCPYLNIHELFACRENRRGMEGEGYQGKVGAGSKALFWKPAEGAEEAALGLLLFALKRTTRLSAYYCSCSTQEMISRHGFTRRMRKALSPAAASPSQPL
ncbi:MAG: radical SAM protein [Elusimicrobiota bacterium]